VTQWAKTLAIELGSYNITVNNVLPGYTKTSRLDELAKSKSLDKKISVDKIYNEWANNNSVKRIGQPEEIANAIIFLCEQLSGYITGQNIIVDGGKLGI
jgi:3-oxoacyl-[acyl-carrier protein] reductase